MVAWAFVFCAHQQQEETVMRSKSVAADLRALAARRMIPWYQLAGEVRLTPTRLGKMLSEKEPIPEAVAERIRQALSVRHDARSVETR
jgi:hypothetical protein